MADSVATAPAAARLAAFVTGARYADLPATVVEKGKEQIVFFISRAFEGASSPEGRQARQVFASAAQRDGVTLIADRMRLAPSDAACANCSQMRGAGGRDDVIWPAGIHAGVITLPTAFAVGESRGRSGRELLLALALGYEVMGKLGRAFAAWSARLPRRPTNVYGAFGPVTVAGRLLKLGTERLSHAYGYAANLGIGIPESGMMDHYYGLVNRNGILAAELAGAGGTAYSAETIEGSAGLFRSYFGEVPSDLPLVIDRLGSDWEILTAEQKRYPGTGQNAVAISLLLEVMRREQLMGDDIEAIDVVQPDDGDSEIRKREVASRGPFERSVQAYSSLPYAISVALLDGDVKLARYPDLDDLELLNDPKVAALMSRVTLTFEIGHTPRYCRLVVRRKDGGVIRREVDTFGFSFPRDAWQGALEEFGTRWVSRARLALLAERVAALESVADIGDLLALTVPDRAQGATS